MATAKSKIPTPEPRVQPSPAADPSPQEAPEPVVEQPKAVAPEPVAPAPEPTPKAAPAKASDTVLVVPSHPYPVYVPTQKIRISPSNPRELVLDSWVESQIKEGVLRVI